MFESRRLDQIAVFREILADFGRETAFFFAVSVGFSLAEAAFSCFLGSNSGSKRA